MKKPLPADKYDPDTLMSYQEWKDCERFVLKGSKMRCRDAVGVPQFSVDQVTDPVMEDEEPYEDRPLVSNRLYGERFDHSFDNFMENTQHKHHSASEVMDAVTNDGTWDEPTY